eukprot:gb/GECG01014197.1/.p1 GENE.gb/GECG01014197.1/~~gb/GECG01014197.1/.p1  ORF type:complete len:121 (+),score=13.71 gb/GECG01014197.1/:1-363(+)
MTALLRKQNTGNTTIDIPSVEGTTLSVGSVRASEPHRGTAADCSTAPRCIIILYTPGDTVGLTEAIRNKNLSGGAHESSVIIVLDSGSFSPSRMVLCGNNGRTSCGKKGGYMLATFAGDP